ncbi:MAG: tRNA preQ1(34) S-adenosylmethionine ribosyltransferase-isomerase QueA [Pyrinomonadaceae bacterium]|nr:tRNA preQ1(34) S-adenosylmethionine ribosyltransferase-isomerase QueA [Pyrinomonadaceae bacterium]
MLLSDFDYNLPEDLIAQQPAARREASQMLFVDRQTASFSDHSFADLPSFLQPDDLLVLNNTKVFPARLHGKTETGAVVETFLIQEIEPYVWTALARPAKRLRPDKKIIFSDLLTAELIEKHDDGKVSIRFSANGDLMELIETLGKTPLPPYIKREKTAIDDDRERYQTVYAKNRGAIAAPTAGLHFSPDVLDEIRAKGVEIAEITLHVGYGTFEPVRVDDIAKHTVLPERYEIDLQTTDMLNAAKASRRRVVAIGTTTTRALESNITNFGTFTAGKHSAAVTITPGYQFLAVDALLTNFHLPKSSLLVLTSVFGGHQLIMDAYRHAVAKNYRFYSYGDCMLVL